MMVNMITAVYENGVLRPLKPLPLRERQEVRVQILPLSQGDEMTEAIQMLVSAGLLTPPVGQSEVTSPSEEERLTLAARLGRASARPLSEVIIEDRDA
jgi:predicted DNA-binding antitoxin AbrB/MazE fold protein